MNVAQAVPTAIIEGVLFRQRFLDGIRSGAITLAFRRWRRPTVRTGGTLITPVGQLRIALVSPVDLNRISDADAQWAGYESLNALLAELCLRSDGEVYRIEFGQLRQDPRVALRDSVILTEQERQEVLARLQKLDTRSPEGPWTFHTLDVIRLHPGLRARDLCCLVGQEKDRFKLNVRKLKNLGLTESLGTGYRLSARGEAFIGETPPPYSVASTPNAG
jgi:hypothetical protein